MHSKTPIVVKKACEWLAIHQLHDGGWGENFESCEVKEYVAAKHSQVINTCWAVLALLAVGFVYSLKLQCYLYNYNYDLT